MGHYLGNSIGGQEDNIYPSGCPEGERESAEASRGADCGPRAEVFLALNTHFLAASMAPQRKSDFSQIVLRALCTGTCVSLVNACVAGECWSVQGGTPGLQLSGSSQQEWG